MYVENQMSFTTRLFNTKIILHSSGINSTAFANLKAINKYGMKLSIFNNKKAITDRLVVEIPNGRRDLTITAVAEVIERHQIDCHTVITVQFISMTQLNQRKIRDLMDALHAS